MNAAILEKIRVATEETLGAVRKHQAYKQRRQGTRPRLGDKFIVSSDYDWGIDEATFCEPGESREAFEWCIVRRLIEAPSECVLLVPCDQVTTMIGRFDVFVPPRFDGLAGYVMRCCCAIWCDTRLIDMTNFTGHIPRTYYKQARQITAGIVRGNFPPDTPTDCDPAYERLLNDAYGNGHWIGERDNALVDTP